MPRPGGIRQILALALLAGFYGAASAQTAIEQLLDNEMLPEPPQSGTLGNLSFETLASPDWLVEDAAAVPSVMQSPDLARTLDQLAMTVEDPLASEVQLYEMPIGDLIEAPDVILNLPFPEASMEVGAGGGLYDYPPDLNIDFADDNPFNLPAGVSSGVDGGQRICPEPKDRVIVVKELPDHFKVGNRTTAIYNGHQRGMSIGVQIDGTMQAFAFAPGEFMAFLLSDAGEAIGEVRTKSKGADRRPLNRGSIYSVVRAPDGKLVFEEIRNGNQ